MQPAQQNGIAPPKVLSQDDEFWHELVAAGIGGQTVEEAKERMSHIEAVRWSLYLIKHGSLHPGLNLERAAAVISMVVNRTGGGRAEVEDFLPRREPGRSAVADTDEAVVAAFFGRKK